MLLCPLMYYGSAQERDMDFAQFGIMFKAIFLEGFARPPEGVRRVETERDEIETKDTSTELRTALRDLRIELSIHTSRVASVGGSCRSLPIRSTSTATRT